MKIEIDWETFHSRFFITNTIYVKEHDTYFEFYTADGIFSIHTIKEKHENTEENIIFIERYMTDKKNIIKVMNFEGYEELIEESEEKIEEEFIEKLEDDIQQ